ncbi:MarR family winged helix-turn-helix transcriptional regulator [Actinokineospora terrae]|uniref:MarR family transcriptional regulator n=1 Tax=Actinokineospora terrae TaxID=155974 RepID=A0A1H9LKT9_9PSEU|nr:MarR family winged helix-turn-helix transcriptional regulator [Actinokineospora terrae]SER12101.1 hypothetical protein SAMN04487818_101647 [Actinokineospora terrae]
MTPEALSPAGWEGSRASDRRPDPTDGRYTLATPTDEGMAALVDSAPGHVDTVRRVVFDSLTKAQVRQLRDIARRVNQATGDNTPC